MERADTWRCLRGGVDDVGRSAKTLKQHKEPLSFFGQVKLQDYSGLVSYLVTLSFSHVITFLSLFIVSVKMPALTPWDKFIAVDVWNSK